jgi:hypothetical protein
MVSLLIRSVYLVVGCIALYIAVFMYEKEPEKWQDRIDELWITISDRGKLIGSQTTAFFNVVASKVLIVLDKVYGKKNISVRMVGMSTILSVGAALIITGSNILPPYDGHAQSAIGRQMAWAGLFLLALAIPPLLTRSTIAIVPTLIPAGLCILFFLMSLLDFDIHANWSREASTALFLSLCADIATTILIRRNIAWISRETRPQRIALAIGAQILWVLALLLTPGVPGYLIWKRDRRSPLALTLLLTFGFNFTTGFLVVAFAISLAFVAAHKLFWPILGRAFYPLNHWKIIQNRKLMGGVGVVCLAQAFHPRTGILKALMEVLAK